MKKALIRVANDAEIMASIFVYWDRDVAQMGRWLATYLSTLRMKESLTTGDGPASVSDAGDLAVAVVSRLRAEQGGAVRRVYLIPTKSHNSVAAARAAGEEEQVDMVYRVCCAGDTAVDKRIFLERFEMDGTGVFTVEFDGRGGGLTARHEEAMSRMDRVEREWTAVVHIVDGTMGLTAIRVRWSGESESLLIKMMWYLHRCRVGCADPGHGFYAVSGADDLAATIIWRLRSARENGEFPFDIRLEYPEGNATMPQLIQDASLHGADQVFRIAADAPEKGMLRLEMRRLDGSEEFVMDYDGKGRSWRPGCERAAACES